MNLRKTSIPEADRTPHARLAEGRAHALVGYQLAQATITTSQVFEAQAGRPCDLRPVEFTILTLIQENPDVSASQLARALAVTADLPFVAHASRELWQIKIVVLGMIFVYAFFKFTWSLRQFNMLSLLVGAAPPPGEGSEAYAQRFAKINSLSGDEFNRGIRAYYFGLAAVFWFVQPWVFAAITTVIVAVLFRRDFRSKTLAAMLP